MAEQCFIGPGYLRLLKATGSFSVVNTVSGAVIGSFSGTAYKGSTSSDSVPGEVYIPSGQSCARYPDNWGTPNCGCPDIPILDFVADNVSGVIDSSVKQSVDVGTCAGGTETVEVDSVTAVVGTVKTDSCAPKEDCGIDLTSPAVLQSTTIEGSPLEWHPNPQADPYDNPTVPQFEGTFPYIFDLTNGAPGYLMSYKWGTDVQLCDTSEITAVTIRYIYTPIVDVLTAAGGTGKDIRFAVTFNGATQPITTTALPMGVAYPNAYYAPTEDIGVQQTIEMTLDDVSMLTHENIHQLKLEAGHLPRGIAQIDDIQFEIEFIAGEGCTFTEDVPLVKLCDNTVKIGGTVQVAFEPECQESVTSEILCLVDDVPGVGLAGEPVLLVRKENCNGVVSNKLYTTTSPPTEILEVVNLEACADTPQLKVLKVCVIDEAGVQWSKSVFIDEDGNTAFDAFYIDLENGTAGTPTGDESNFTLCEGTYTDYRFQKLCEHDSDFILMVSSTGEFARYSFSTGKVEAVDTLSVTSSGGAADYENFLLYNFVAPDILTTVDVNTDTQLPDITLTTLDGSPLTFSASAFDADDGFLYSWDVPTSKVYRTNVITGDVSLDFDVTGVVGTGSSMAIDSQGRMIIMGSDGKVYEINRTTGLATLIYTSTGGGGNGATFDADDNLYLASGTSVNKITDLFGTPVETTIIDEWLPGANSLAYYGVQAGTPSCFLRQYGVLPDGSVEYTGDFNITDFSPRTVVGDVDCCCSDKTTPVPKVTPTLEVVNGSPATVGVGTYAYTYVLMPADGVEVETITAADFGTVNGVPVYLGYFNGFGLQPDGGIYASGTALVASTANVKWVIEETR